MNSKKILIIVGIVVVIGVIGIVALLLRGDEDTWLCRDGQWTRHGNPTAMPDGLCEDKKIIGESPAVPEPENKINNFEECAAAGNAVMESYPRQCRSGEQNFTEDIGNELEKVDLIKVDYPRPNQIVKSPLKITGQARGNWFFEASFPIRLLDEDGSELGIAIATTKEDWMTENFVPFSASLEFAAPKGKTGSLILKKDNPSGLPENDDELRIPVVF